MAYRWCWRLETGARSTPRARGGGAWHIHCYTFQVTARFGRATSGKVLSPSGVFGSSGTELHFMHPKYFRIAISTILIVILRTKCRATRETKKLPMSFRGYNWGAVKRKLATIFAAAMKR